MKSSLTLRAVCLVTISSLLLACSEARAGLLAYEPFTNAPGALIIGAGGGFGFSGTWQANSSGGTATNTSFGLGYTDGGGHILVTTTGAGFFQGLTTANTSMQPNRQFNFTRATNGEAATTWISLLLVRQGPTNGSVGNPYPRGVNITFDYPNSSGGGNQRLGVGNSSGAATNTVGILSAGGNLRPSSNPPYQYGGSFGPVPPITNFVVLRVDHIAGTPQQANDNAYLWVNPNLAVEPALATAATNVLGLFDYSIGLVRVFVGGQDAGANRPYGEVVVDEIRVGETYADVTPYVGAPAPVALVITNTALIPGGIVLSGIGGSNGGIYRVLATTNVTTPLANWPVLTTNAFDGSGKFNTTNPTTSGAAQEFFRLLLGGNLPAPGIAPSITAQPVSQLVNVSNNATFTVTAAGTAPLAYQWYFNITNVLSGATSASLTLTNAQTSNAGGYSVIVTNNYGAATSTVATLTVTSVTIPPANYYISPTGSDANSGTNINQPWYSLSKATAVANPGNLIYLRGGTYNYSARIQMNRSGSLASPIRVSAYPGELPVLDFSAESSGTRGIEVTGHYWQLYRLEVSFAGDNGIYITGKSNLVEVCVTHDCEDSGLQLHQSGAAYNVILNCDSYRNYDPVGFGDDADGFAAKFTLGPGNVFGGCRSWENSDDGWDFWETAYQIVMTNCWTFHNGYDVFGVGPSFNGNGNGFKLGGNYIYGPHYVANCLSFSNRVNGFDQNNNLAGHTMDNCTSAFNGGRNFDLEHGTNITPHVVRNTVSLAGGLEDEFRTGSLLTNNSWQVISPAVNVADFVSVMGSLAKAPRQADGSLPVINFMRPVNGGRLVDQGVNVGRPFNGAAPDLGAFETGP